MPFGFCVLDQFVYNVCVWKSERKRNMDRATVFIVLFCGGRMGGGGGGGGGGGRDL